MKYPTIIFTSVFLFLLGMNVHAQELSLKNNSLNLQNANLSSAEMMNFMKMMMEESELLINEINPLLEEGSLQEINVEITVTYEVVQPLDLAPRYWNEYAVNSQIARDFFTFSSQYITDFYELISDSKIFEKRMENPFFKKYKSKEFVGEDQVSLLHHATSNDWVNLNNRLLLDHNIFGDKKLTASLNNWKFNVGPGDGWNY